MPPTTDEGVLFCAGCGNTAATLDEVGRGPCCHNLPTPWHCGRDGLYNQRSESEDYEEEDEREEDEQPRCPNCGSTTWIVRAEQRVQTHEGDGETIYYDYDDFNLHANCAACETVNRSYRLEQSG